MTRLALVDVTCRRGGRTLFSNLSLAIDAGGSALIEGPNGVGKSSLIRLTAGLLVPASGTVDCEGTMALSDEGLALDPEKSLATALAFWARLDGAGADAVPRALGALALDHLADVPVRMLSTGQRKRASLARIAASGAAIWLLDEPGNGLDSDALALLGALMQAHVTSGGIVLAASHQSLPLDFGHTMKLARP